MITGLAVCLVVLITPEARGFSAQARPTPFPAEKTVHTIAFPAPTSSALDILRIGTVVPKADITAGAADTHQLRFGLAVYPSSQTYPATSTDAGTTWRIDGPLLYMAAARGQTSRPPSVRWALTVRTTGGKVETS